MKFNILLGKRKLIALLHYFLVVLCLSVFCVSLSRCGSRGGGGQGVWAPPKNHKNIWFSSNTGPDTLKNRKYQASIQCWVNNGTPAERHLMAFRWRDDDGPLIAVLGSSFLSSTKNQNKKQKKKKTLSKLDPL